MAYRPKNTQEKILHRLKISKGHIEKIIKMIEDDVYCIDILHQMNAVENGIQKTSDVILESHLKTCAADAIAKGKQKEAINEIMQVFKRKS